MEYNPPKAVSCPSCGSLMQPVKPATSQDGPIFACNGVVILGEKPPKAPSASTD